MVNTSNPAGGNGAKLEVVKGDDKTPEAVNRTLADSRIIVIYDKSRSLKENIEELPMGGLIGVPKSLLDSQEIIKLLKDGSLLITLSDYSRNNQDIVRIERVGPCLSVVK